ncbi:MAG: hemin uptake protein HemP [Thiobacillus sp.]|nr:hemin uptake protein HemP [Thiobacillus sp.]
MRPDLPEIPPTAPSLLIETEQRSGAPGLIRADHLFQGGQEILIDHKGETYRLRITKNGKLILTK